MKTTVEPIVQLMQAAGYAALPTPFVIGGVRFEFAAALLAGPKGLDLVVVIDALEEPSLRTEQKLGALCRALDVLGSRRPVTAVVVGPRLPASRAAAVSRTCRLLTIETEIVLRGGSALVDALAVLLPLELPQLTDGGLDPIQEIYRQLALEDRAAVTAILAAGLTGTEGVVGELSRQLQRALGSED